MTLPDGFSFFSSKRGFPSLPFFFLFSKCKLLLLVFTLVGKLLLTAKLFLPAIFRALCSQFTLPSLFVLFTDALVSQFLRPLSFTFPLTSRKLSFTLALLTLLLFPTDTVFLNTALFCHSKRRFFRCTFCMALWS